MKFRRKSADLESIPEADESLSDDESASPLLGPFDADEPPPGIEFVDLGSLLIQPEPGRELRVQVNEQTGEVQAVLLAGADGAVELRAFSAPRNGDLWSTVRPQIAAEHAQRGSVATEREGRFGTELICQTTAKNSASNAPQQSRIIGINGPRWFLRATLIGSPASDFEGSVAWEDTIAKIGVRRGSGAMPVGEPLAVALPEDARRIGDDVETDNDTEN